MDCLVDTNWLAERLGEPVQEALRDEAPHLRTHREAGHERGSGGTRE